MKKTVILLALILPVCALIAQPLPAPVLPQAGNISDVVQLGANNDVDVVQDGIYNYSEVRTLGFSNGESFVDQKGTMNTSTVNQFGVDNTVNVKQRNGNHENVDRLNYSWINQMGDENEAEVVQKHANGYGPAGDGTLEAYVFQTGVSNEALQKQKGKSNLAIATQLGDNGGATQLQGNTPLADGKAAFALAAIVQLPDADGSYAEQHQVGVYNVAGIVQQSNLSKANQLQVTDETNTNPLPNVAGIVQTKGIFGVAINNNQAYQVQYYDGVSTYGNWAGALQMGGHNYSYQTQIGGNNFSGVTQLGYGNTATVSQTNGATAPAGMDTAPW